MLHITNCTSTPTVNNENQIKEIEKNESSTIVIGTKTKSM